MISGLYLDILFDYNLWNTIEVDHRTDAVAPYWKPFNLSWNIHFKANNVK